MLAFTRSTDLRDDVTRTLSQVNDDDEELDLWNSFHLLYQRSTEIWFTRIINTNSSRKTFVKRFRSIRTSSSRKFWFEKKKNNITFFFSDGNFERLCRTFGFSQFDDVSRFSMGISRCDRTKKWKRVESLQIVDWRDKSDDYRRRYRLSKSRKRFLFRIFLRWKNVFVDFKKEFQHQSDYEIREFINNNDVALGSLRRHALATYEMTKRSGLDGMIRDQYTVRDHLHFLMKEGGTWQHWWRTFLVLMILTFLFVVSRAVIRFVSSLLHKMIDSLAPSVTNLLVRGKIVRWTKKTFVFSFKNQSFLRLGDDRCFWFWRSGDRQTSQSKRKMTKKIDRFFSFCCFRNVQMKFIKFSTDRMFLVKIFFIRFFFKNF